LALRHSPDLSACSCPCECRVERLCPLTLNAPVPVASCIREGPSHLQTALFVLSLSGIGSVRPIALTLRLTRSEGRRSLLARAGSEQPEGGRPSNRACHRPASATV